MDSILTEILMFDNKIFNEFDEFRKQIESKIEIKSSNYNGEYNRFKKCPHCGLIWFKIKGCDSVQCGKRCKVTDKIVGRYKKYTVKFINNKIVISSEDQGSDEDIIKNNNNINIRGPSIDITLKGNINLIINENKRPEIIDNNVREEIKEEEEIEPREREKNDDDINEDEFIGLTKKEKIENEEREKKGKIKIKPLGCGRELDWKEMEDCSNEVIEKLKEIAVDDYYSGLWKINDKMKKK